MTQFGFLIIEVYLSGHAFPSVRTAAVYILERSRLGDKHHKREVLQSNPHSSSTYQWPAVILWGRGGTQTIGWTS